ESLCVMVYEIVGARPLEKANYCFIKFSRLK
ncbi:MAG: hypothetical protein Harvfovirus52_1, partial [Harvfovirus sp.]